MRIKAVGDNILYGTAEGTQLVLVHDTNDDYRKVKLPVISVPVMRNIFSSVATVQKV